MAPKVTFWDPFSELWATCGIILGSQWPSRAHSKSFQKMIENLTILGPPGAPRPFAADRVPAQQKTHIFGKSSVFAAEG